jgi:hypothetical protein
MTINLPDTISASKFCTPTNAGASESESELPHHTRQQQQIQNPKSINPTKLPQNTLFPES